VPDDVNSLALVLRERFRQMTTVELTRLRDSVEEAVEDWPAHPQMLTSTQAFGLLAAIGMSYTSSLWEAASKVTSTEPGFDPIALGC